MVKCRWAYAYEPVLPGFFLDLPDDGGYILQRSRWCKRRGIGVAKGKSGMVTMVNADRPEK